MFVLFAEPPGCPSVDTLDLACGQLLKASDGDFELVLSA